MSCNVPSLSFKELSADPVNPSAGRIKLYAKSDGFYTKDDAGVVTPLATGEVFSTISSLSPIAADQILYTNGVDQFNVSPITLLARQLLDDPDQATMLTTLGAQPLSADLTSFVNNASWVGSAVTFSGSLTAGAMFATGNFTVNGNVQIDTDANVDGNLTVNLDITVGGDVVIGGQLKDGTSFEGSPGNLMSSTGSATEWVSSISVDDITLDSGPTVTAGTAVPAAAAPDGSIYLRSGSPNGSLYVRENGVWTLK